VKFGVEKLNVVTTLIYDVLRCVSLLVQQGLFKALKGVDSLPERMDEENKGDFMERAYSAIQLCLFNEVLRKVVEETMTTRLWKKLETL